MEMIMQKDYRTN